MGSELRYLQTAFPGNLRVPASAPAMRHETSARCHQARRSIRSPGNMIVVVMLALLAVPARGQPACSAFSSLSSPELLLSSIARLPRQSKEVVTMVRHSTSTAATPAEIVRVACAVSGNPKQGRLAHGARGYRNPSPWSSGRGAGALCGAVGDGNNGGEEEGSSFDSEAEQQQQDNQNTRDEDNLPMFSFASVEDELQSRSEAKTAAPGVGSGVGDGADNESRWLPRFFPPPVAGQDGEEFQPLVELPLDGVLLQLFPALLIGVVGLFLMIAVQVEASRFDGMVGEDGGAVVVTDLRDTTTEQQQ